AAGDFAPQGGALAATGTVQVGLAPQANTALTPLLNLNGGARVDIAGGTFTTDGSIDAVISSKTVRLFDGGTHPFSAAHLVSKAGFGLSGTLPKLDVAGGKLSVSDVRLTDSGIELQGSLSLPQIAGLTLAVQGDDHVAIDKNGVHLTGLDVDINQPLGFTA